jgi:hypothetical protein
MNLNQIAKQCNAASQAYFSGDAKAYGDYKRLKNILDSHANKRCPSRKAQRQEAISKARELVLKYGIDAYEKIIVMVWNDYVELVEGMNEDEKLDYAMGIVRFVEHQAGGAFRS